jgi:hypothetical protein
VNPLLCPVCGSKQIGKIGIDQFYCWSCLVEFNSNNDVFQITEDGVLIAYTDEDLSEIEV